MDSGDFQQVSQSPIDDSQDTLEAFNSSEVQSQTPTTHQKTYVDLEQFVSGMISSNFQYLQNLPHLSSQFQQQHGPNISYQGLLSAPNGNNIPAPPEPSKPSQKRKKPSLQLVKTPVAAVRHWTLDEDIALTKARLHVSCDPVVGVGQKSDTLWRRILQVWRQNMGVYDTTRDFNSLSCRWGRIHPTINKFHACYEHMERENKSGATPEDWKRWAHRMYQGDGANPPFKHEECWEICRTNVKWCTQQLTKQNGGKKRKSAVHIFDEDSPTPKQTHSDQTSIPAAPEVLCSETNNEELQNTNDEGVTRPTIGRKGVKDQKKKAVAEKGVADALSSLQSSLERQFGEEIELKKEIKKKDNELREKMFKEEIELKRKALKRKEDERILAINLSKLAPNVRMKFERMQAKILKEWENDGCFGDTSSNDDASGV